MKKRISYCAVLGLAVAAFGFNAEAKDAKDLASSFALSAGAYYKTVTVSQRYDVKSDLTVPARVSLKFENGGAFKLAKDATLTINGSIEAPMQQIFDGSVVFGPGRVSKVYPQWWGAMGDGTHDDTAAIQSAIDSLSRGGTVFFPPGEYANKGVTTASKVRFKGAGVGSSAMKFTPKDGACIKLPVDCASFRLEDMSLVTSGESLAYGIDGTNEYVRYFSMRNFSVKGFKTGIYIQQGMHITLDYGYIGCYGQGKANGTVGIKLGDKALNKGCTTATLKDLYMTNAETNLYNRAAPCLLIRPIFETCQIGFDNYARSVVLSPFMEACKKADVRMTDNGALMIGVSADHYKAVYDDDTTRRRTSWIPDTFDCPAKLGPLHITHKGELSVEVSGSKGRKKLTEIK